ncbi:hypothetical protein CMI47_07230 [Candidatus Pacearchaeota archaeon]|nr:hypothetical protein [Candidatus Pacearchaeota archaeon]|tara:strand:- start:1316 stop:1651 length:336 start_codon:yes stop_codon:yes gene_type:complete
MNRFDIQRFDYGAPPKDAAWDLLSAEEQQKALDEWEAQQEFIPIEKVEEEEGFSLWKLYSGATLIGSPLAIAFGYYRSKRILFALGTGFIWLPYLMYVGIDTLTNKNKEQE